MKTIFITSFHVLVSRNILLSPLLGKLTDNGWRVVVIVPKKKEEYFKNTFSSPSIFVEGVTNKLNRLDSLIREFALASLRTRALEIMRNRNMGLENPRLQKVLFWAPTVRRLIPWFYGLVISRHTFHEIFEKYKPDLLFSTDVFSSNDCRWMLEAKAHKVKTVGMIRSWDNLISKGGFRIMPDILVSQNEIVKDEAIHLHNIKSSNVKVVGIPHYDNYLVKPECSRNDFLKEVGIPENKKYFVYAPLGDRIIKVGSIVKEHDYDDRMIKIIDENLPDDSCLIVRFPPTDTVKVNKDNLSKRVVFMSPGIRFGDGVKGVRSSEMGYKDDLSLFYTLYYSNGVINPFSSLCIDAVFLDRPVVIPSFDPKQVSYWESVSRLQEFEHFIPVMKSAGVKIAHNPLELRQVLMTYYLNPEKDKEVRKRLAEIECFSRDGKSSERLYKVIRDII